MREINSSKNSKTNERKSLKEQAVQTNSKSVLEAFEFIVELAEKSNFDDEFFDKAALHIRYASRKIKLSPLQTVLLALFVDRCEDSNIRLSDIAKYVGCRTTKMLRYCKDVDVLEEKRYILGSRSHKLHTYRVTDEALEAIKEGKPYDYTPMEVTDIDSFFGIFNDLIEQKDDDELTHDRLLTLTLEGLDSIKDTIYATSLRRLGLGDENILLFTYMAHLFIEDNDDDIGFYEIDDIFDNAKIPNWCKRELRNRSSDLFVHNLIENANENGMARSDAFKLTNYAKTEVLGELNLIGRAISTNSLLKHDSFAPKELIYNKKEDRQISELTDILSENKFKEVQNRLEAAGMRKGFCCLFYGAPGTGKTETVYQLARQTGRDIMRVDVDKIKSCWVGESEKNIKAFFDRYRNICKSAELAPILLFNEADAVLGVRMEGATQAVDKMENSIQNIILQEMETIDGIMIATTNLTTNLDKAFERRFLYKVRYEKPTVEARTKIWKAMLPGLSHDEAIQLADEAELTGGEIENIVRKQSVAAILSDSEIIDLSAIRRLCHTERIDSNRKSIGF